MHDGRQDLTSILGNLAKVLPPLPPLPFQLPKPPSPEDEPSGEPSGGFVDVRGEVVEKQTEKDRAAQAAKGIITLHYE